MSIKIKKFKRTKENFICGNCGRKVKGNGYTNHCPHCLWSKHVDINPGDRLEKCRGLMEPIGIEMKDGENKIRHRCVRCKFEKINKIEEDDNIIKLIKIITPPYEGGD